MLHPSTIQLLRFHFSLFLAPVYFFAVSQLPTVNWSAAVLIFFILHGLVYPSSNGYNSYMDRDSSPIGGLKNPLQPTRQLFHVSIMIDVVALLLSFLISPLFFAGVAVYIMISRAYSYRGIRLKRYPIAGFVTVFLCQGALVYFLTYHGCHPDRTMTVPILPMLIASLLIGALYPLTQIYQHDADLADGVRTISSRLGKRGTFIFSLLQFLGATAGFFFLFQQQGKLSQWLLFLVVMLPVVLFFLYWMSKVWQNGAAADFKHSLRMNVLSTCCTTFFFITLNLMNH